MIKDILNAGYSFFINYENPPAGIGYGQFSRGHLILVLCSALMTTVIVINYKKAGQTGRIRLRRTIALLLVILELVKQTFLYLQGVHLVRYLPLEVCSFAAYAIICDSILTENRFLPELLVTIFLPAAIMQHISPSTAVLPLVNYFTFSQFFFHGLIIAYVLSRFLSGEILLTYRGVWASVAKISALAAVVYVINILLGENFMFLLDSEGNYLLDKIYRAAGGGIKYTLGLIVFTMVMIHVFFVIFKVIDMLLVKKGR